MELKKITEELVIGFGTWITITIPEEEYEGEKFYTNLQLQLCDYTNTCTVTTIQINSIDPDELTKFIDSLTRVRDKFQAVVDAKNILENV